MQEINSEFSDSPLRLQYFIIMTGAAYFVFSLLVPTMSAMRRWLLTSTLLTFTYIIILLVVLFKDGTWYAYFALDALAFWFIFSHADLLDLAFSHIYFQLIIVDCIWFVSVEGKSNRNKDYEIRGSNVGKVFNGFGAVSAIIVCNTSGILLEIQVNITSLKERH